MITCSLNEKPSFAEASEGAILRSIKHKNRPSAASCSHTVGVPSEAPKERRMAGWTGLEPAAFCVTGRRSNQLSYHPVLGKDGEQKK